MPPTGSSIGRLIDCGRPRPKRQTNRSEFLAKCTPNAVPLFERILDLASQRGHTINWGEVGFSIRALVPKNNQFISFHRMTFNSISVICHSAKRSNKHYGHA
jgi:hypothetical protein